MFIIHFQSFHTKIKGQPLLSNWIEKVFQSFLQCEKSTGPWKHIFLSALTYMCARIGTNAWQYLPICLNLVPRSLTPVWVRSKNHREVRRWAEGLTCCTKKLPTVSFFYWKKTKHAHQTHEQGKLQHCVYVFVSHLGPTSALVGHRDGRAPVSLKKPF